MNNIVIVLAYAKIFEFDYLGGKYNKCASSTLFLKCVIYSLFSNSGRKYGFFGNKETFQNGPISLGTFPNVR